jgi:hypothetical protein
VPDVLRHTPIVPQLELFFENKGPFTTAHLGDLFSAVTHDYGRLTRGRKLIIAEIRTGTLLVILQDAWAIGGDIVTAASPYVKDAAAMAKSAKVFLDFLKTLRELFARAEKNPGSLAPARTKRSVGARTVRALAKVAAETQSEITVTTRTPHGDTTEIRVTPLQAIQIREGIEAQSRPHSETRQSIAVPDVSEDMSQLFPGMMSDVSAQLSNLAGRSDSELRAVIATVVQMLSTAGMTSMVGDLARHLEMQGHKHAAEILIAEIRGPGRNRNSPGGK